MFEPLRSISDHQILAATEAIIVQDRKLTLRLLQHLREIERRKLYLKRGYSSMFVYCTSHLRLSEGAAMRRIKTSRCLARFPELQGLLESGEVNLMSVSLIARVLKPENAELLIARIRGKSKRAVEEIVAECEPRALIPPDRVRPMVVPAAAFHAITATGGGKKSSGGDEDNRDRSAATDEASPIPSQAGSPQTGYERCARVEFTARDALMRKLDHIRSLASHRLAPGASFEQVVELLADYFIVREDPAIRHERRETKKRSVREEGRGAGANRRSIPAGVRDEVYVRDEGRCVFVAPGGNRCSSTHMLQLDHIVPVARGGKSTVDNLRLLCAHHNRLEGERLMGPRYTGPPAH